MRYLPQTQKSRDEMLEIIGAKTIEDLYVDVPAQAFVDGKASLPDHKGELEVERIMHGYANQNHAACDGPFFLGAGAYYHHVPATVDYIIQRSEYLTAYTPYQPEVAQGTLQMIFEFQTFVAQITGMEIANASLYDGATSATEAALMAMRITKRRKIAIGNKIHPDYRAVLESYMSNFDDIEVVDGGPADDIACVIIQSPDFYGQPHKYEALRKQCDETGALLVVIVSEILSLGLLPAPVEADIVCGEAQSIGVALSYGGPHLGFFACKEKYVRQMPGRLCGITKDADGKRGFVLTLNTREQHIRRDKATSNICTNQGLCALAFTVHMSLLGEDGFKQLAIINHEAACKTADAVTAIDGVTLETDSFFNEFTISLPKNAKDVVEALAQKGIIAGYAPHEKGDENKLIMCATEITQDSDIEAVTGALKEALA
ncbi:MAG: aminomethyl-transferring glycine dehydrogenase subunit GcvPA [Bdellovibrionales bacterium]